MSGRTILLISANSETVPAPVYPLALPRLAAAVERAGHSATQFDPQVHGATALPHCIRSLRPDLIGLSLRNLDNTDSDEPRSYVPEYASLVRDIRKYTPAPIVVGGSAFSLLPNELMRVLDVEYGVVGPGESALCRLLDALGSARDIAQIPGVLTRGSAARAEAPPSPPLSPSEHNPELLRHYWDKGGMIGIQTKRGCPRRCIYCTYPLVDGCRVQWADPVQLADDMQRLLTDFGVNYFFITDSVFNLNAAREAALAEEIIRRSLSLSWGAFFAPTPMTGDYLKTLKRSGLTHIEFGTDSLSDRVLAAYRKDLDVAQVLRTSSLCSELRLDCAHYLLFGGPGETPETVRESVANAARLNDCVFFPFAGIRIYPRTDLHNIALKENVISHDNDCLDPVFYFAPGLTASAIWEILGKHKTPGRHWVAPSDYAAVMPVLRGLRERGKKGPLWDFLIARKSLRRMPRSARSRAGNPILQRPNQETAS